MTKLNLDYLTYFDISQNADMAFTTLLGGEKKIEVIYDDYFVFRIHNKANGVWITLVAIDDDTSLSDEVDLYRIDVNPSRIAFAMTYLLAIYFKDRWFEARRDKNKEPRIEVKEILSFDVPEIKKKKRKD